MDECSRIRVEWCVFQTFNENEITYGSQGDTAKNPTKPLHLSFRIESENQSTNVLYNGPASECDNDRKQDSGNNNRDFFCVDIIYNR